MPNTSTKPSRNQRAGRRATKRRRYTKSDYERIGRRVVEGARDGGTKARRRQ